MGRTDRKTVVAIEGWWIDTCVCVREREMGRTDRKTVVAKKAGGLILACVCVCVCVSLLDKPLNT